MKRLIVMAGGNEAHAGCDDSAIVAAQLRVPDWVAALVDLEQALADLEHAAASREGGGCVVTVSLPATAYATTTS